MATDWSLEPLQLFVSICMLQQQMQQLVRCYKNAEQSPWLGPLRHPHTLHKNVETAGPSLAMLDCSRLAACRQFTRCTAEASVTQT